MKTQRKEFEAELRKGVTLVCLHLKLYFCTFSEYRLGAPWIVWYCRDTKLIKGFLSFYFYVKVKVHMTRNFLLAYSKELSK